MEGFKGVDVSSIKEKFAGNSVIETQEAFLQHLQASHRERRKCGGDQFGIGGAGAGYDVSKLKEMFGGDSVLETAEAFRKRQAQMKEQYQQAEVRSCGIIVAPSLSAHTNLLLLL